MNDFVDVVVVGAGVVGLAVARAMALQGYEVIVLERHGQLGQETSSRNSGVIHSGIYYPRDTLKARLCVRGRGLLYEYCCKKGLAYRRCGKLIVAQESQVGALEALHKRGLENGVSDLEWLEQQEITALEPEVRCVAALLSPSTGIVDVHELMKSLQGDIEASQGSVVFKSQLLSVKSQDDRLLARVCSGDELGTIACRYLINSAGLSALDFLAKVEGYPSSHRRSGYYAKGNYFSCQGVQPFSHLVYPMPNEAGLGVHATLDLQGATRFGPDVEWVNDVENYRVDESRATSFYSAIREYWPGLPDGALYPAYAGIRPKLVGPADKASDFVIEWPSFHGVSGLVNLLGIESPGLTSSLAIGEYVVAMLSEKSSRL